MTPPDPPAALAPLAAALRTAERVVVFSGAGLSQGSGIPTYRDAGGLWTKPGNLRYSSAEALRDDPAGFREFWSRRRAQVGAAAPNAAHHALAALQRLKAGTTLVTQNIDGLLGRAGCTGVLELHGNLMRDRCVACGWAGAAGAGGRCPGCGGATLRPDVVMFGEYLDGDVIAAAEQAAAAARLMLVVGTSAVVFPAAGLIGLAARRGAAVAVLNAEPVELEAPPDFFFQGLAERLVPAVVQGLANAGGAAAAGQERAPAAGLGPAARAAGAFLAGTGRDHRGRTLDTILAWADDDLEAHHDFIQWLFPLTEPSGVNPHAPVPGADDFAQLARDEAVRDGARRAFLRMLAFYGLRPDDGRVERSANWAERSAHWARRPGHNDLRLTRILKAMRLLGAADAAASLLAALEAEVPPLRGGRAAMGTTLRYWREAVGAPA